MTDAEEIFIIVAYYGDGSSQDGGDVVACFRTAEAAMRLVDMIQSTYPNKELSIKQSVIEP